MLEGLDHVEWANLWACGWATEIPQLLRALASPDKAVRQEAWEKLPHRLVYQGGSIMEATSYAVPFLLEVLTSDVLEEQTDLLCLLATIAKGGAFLIGAGALNDYADEASAPPDLQAELAEQRGWVRRSYEAVEQGAPIYLTFLAHPEAQTRLFAAYLLSLFPAQARESAPQLRALLAREEDELVQAQLVLSLGTLLEPEAASLQFLRTYLRADRPPLVRFVAAVASARRAQAATPPEVVQRLVDSVAIAETLETSYQQLPEVGLGDYDSFAVEVCKILALVEPAQAVPAMLTILHGLRAAGGAPGAGDFHERFTVAEFLLAAVFPKGASRPGQLGMPVLLALRPHIDVFHQQARKAWYQEGVEVEATLEAVNALLVAAFSQKSPLSAAPLVRPGAPALTEAQRAALTALVDEELLWSSALQEYEVRNRHTLFTGYGLPGSRDALRHLLERHGASPAEPLAPTLTPLQNWVVSALVRFDVLWESEQDLRLRLEQILMSYGLPPSRAALGDLLLG